MRERREFIVLPSSSWSYFIVSFVFFMLPLIICDYSYSLGFGLLTLPLILTPAWLRFSPATCLDSYPDLPAYQ